MPEPRVSVVMSVFNGERFLREAIESILTQDGVELELVIVDDASTDTTPAILSQAVAADSRVKLLRQAENQGLTRSLIRGCAAAAGEYIARIDADDIALPGRLARQVHTLDANRNVSFVSCGTRFVTDEGDLLYEGVQNPEEAQSRLLELEPHRVQGVSSHSSVMFRRSAYEAVRGYREEFYFAQDLDLWIRLAESGRFLPMPETLQIFRVHPGALTSRWRAQQSEMTELILESARLRRAGLCEAAVLVRAALLRPGPNSRPSRRALADGLYFIGACLRRNRNPNCRGYFRRSLAANPLHVRALLALLVSPGERAGAVR
jgi:glycosyltransferase involved in cell wall biosynthesis